MIRLACDSDRLASLVETNVVLTYSDLVPGTAALRDLEHRFPLSEIGLIARGLGDPTGAATIADVEAGTLSLAQAGDWLIAKRAQGWSCLTFYGSQTTLANLAQMVGPHGWWRWFARWGTVLKVPGHPDAMLQFDNDPDEHVDWTLIRNPHWHPRARG
jgi:hypothetical protein